MDKILEIINLIKKIHSSMDEDQLRNEIEKRLIIELKRNIITINDIPFLIELTVQNINLFSENIRDIFLNSKKKIEHKIILPADNEQIAINNDKIINNNYITMFLNILSIYGSIYIKPEDLVLFWNENSNAKSKFNLKSSECFKNFSSVIKDNDNEIKIIIKYVNYNIFDRDIINNDKNFKMHKKKLLLKTHNNGYKSFYQLSIPLDTERIYYSTNNYFYKGVVVIYFNKKKKEFLLDNNSDLKEIIKYFKDDLLIFFKKNQDIFIKNLYLFISNNIFSPYLTSFIKALETDDLPPLKKIYNDNEIITFKEKDQKIFYYNIEKCKHDTIFDEIVLNKDNFFENVNKFIQKHVEFINGIAICNLCNENISFLNIKGQLYLDNSKYIAHINDNILKYHPYNKFNDTKYYFDNFFYLFNYHTKLNYLGNNNLIVRLILDNFMEISSNRLELENKYKKNIANDEIFLLRLTNNFFEINNNEKELYQDKKIIFSYFLIIVTIMILLSIRDYNEIIFLKKVIPLTKLKKNIKDITYEEIVALFVDFIFKKLKIDFFSDLTEKERIKKYIVTIKIFREIFTKEATFLFDEKKNIVETFINKKNQIVYTIDIPIIEDDAVTTPIPMNLKLVKNYRENDKIISLKRNYDSFEYNIGEIYKIEKQIPINTNDTKSYYNKENNYIYINFNDFDIDNFNNPLLNDLNEEFLSKKTYVYNDKIVEIKKNNDIFLLYNNKISLMKSKEELKFLKIYEESNKLKFFLHKDHLIFKLEITIIDFFDILDNYIKFLESFFNIIIESNIRYFFLIKEHTFQITRLILFLYKIELLLFIKDKLNINYDIYKNFLIHEDNEEIVYYI